MVSVYRFVSGYVKISIFGEHPERFLNFCAKNSLSVWSIERKKESICLCIGMSDYLKMHTFRKKIGKDLKVKLVEKYGLPMFKKSVVKRLGVCVGMALFLCINIAMSQFIWQIDVSGNSVIEESEIIDVCEEIGITTGVYRKGIDTYDASQRLALAFNDIAWVSLNIEGSKLTVNISEASKSDKTDAVPRNIIASYDGVIKRIEVIEGTKSVEINQAVRKGDLLVSGVVDNGITTHFVHSDGIVSAQTHRKFTETVQKQFASVSKGEGVATRKAFEFFSFKIPLYLQGFDEQNDSFFTRNRLKLFGDELPISISTRTFLLTEEREVEIDDEQAIDIAMNNIAKKIRTLPIDSILSYKASVEEKGKVFTVNVETVCSENICEYQAINTTNN